MTNRPQISAAQAAFFSRERVLSLTGRAGNETLDPWVPELRPLRNPLVVGQGGYATIQAAIDHAISNRQTQIDIDVQTPETNGLVYIPKGIEVAMTGPATVTANTDCPARQDHHGECLGPADRRGSVSGAEPDHSKHL